MILESLKLKNFRSFGNNENILEFDTEQGNLILLSAPNGSGKCVHPETEIDVELDLNLFSDDEIAHLYDTTDMGKIIFEYILVNEPVRYERIRIKQNNR